jgi:hypothetical protein
MALSYSDLVSGCFIFPRGHGQQSRGGPLLRAMTDWGILGRAEGFSRRQPQIEIAQMWRKKITPFPL